jgi:hypothetical protein
MARTNNFRSHELLLTVVAKAEVQCSVVGIMHSFILKIRVALHSAAFRIANSCPILLLLE